MSFIDLCRELIAIDSSPQAGSREAALWLQRLAQGYGLMVDLQEENFSGQEQANVFIRTGSAQAEEFLLQGHLDTVNPGPHSSWVETRMNPFHGTIKEGKLFGLGACEAKIDLLCKTEALRSFAGRSDWKVAPVIAATCGEEIGMFGMLKAIRKNKFSAKYALVGEPSGHHLIYAGKGYAVLEFFIPFSKEERAYRVDHDLKESVSTQSKLFRGASTHSSAVSDTSGNAINKAFEYLLQLPESVVLMDIEGGTNHNTVANNVVLEIDLQGGVRDPMVKKLRHLFLLLQQVGSEFLIYQDPDFNPGSATMNLGIIKSHEDHVHLTVGFRLPPKVGEEQMQGWFEQIKAGMINVGAECRVGDYKRPYRTDLQSDFVKTCEEALSSIGMPSKFVTQPTCTEMSLLSRKGIQCLGFGAGQRHASNISESFVALADLEKSIEFYKAIIERVCL